jgi:asparagine synthase (glutamine-hydrolysing)
VAKLPAGHLLTIQDPGQPLPVSQPFWSVEQVAMDGRHHQVNGSDAEVVADFDRLLSEAVALRMQSDVPWGALLSGGIDSSTVVALMQSIASGPVKTFTIGFDNSNFDEAADARAVARALGTDHTELMLTGADALNVIPQLPTMFDEPLADPSQIPTYLVCQLARRQVTVALTGDGGDELFTGYNRYLQGEGMINGASRFPHSLRQLTAAGMNLVPSGTWDRIQGRISPPGGQRLLGEKMHKMGKLMREDTPSDMYLSLLSAIHRPEDVVAQGREPGYEITRILETTELPLMERMMLADQMTYLADDLLAKVDRASMAVSLEARVPLLDHRVVEFAWRLPRRFRVRDGKGKWILREVLYRKVPRDLVDRPKMGFSVPIADWIAGPLRPWAEDLLQPARLERNGVFDAAGVRRQWDAFARSPGPGAIGLWAILMLQAWQEHWHASAS